MKLSLTVEFDREDLQDESLGDPLAALLMRCGPQAEQPAKKASASSAKASSKASPKKASPKKATAKNAKKAAAEDLDALLDDGVPTLDEVRKRSQEFAAMHCGGEATELREVLGEFGAKSFADLPAERYADFLAGIDERIKAKEAEA